MTRAGTDRAAALAASTEQQARIKRENAKDKHTPGPWVLEEWSFDYGATGDFSIYPGTQKGCRMPIACVQQPFNGKRTKANARLIAAAPTMYEFIVSSASNGCAEARKIMEAINAGH